MNLSQSAANQSTNASLILAMLVAAGGALSVVSLSGCRLARGGNAYSAGGPEAPPMISATASTAEIVAAVNQNAARVQSYTAPNATFSMPGLPGLPLLRGSVVLQRPRQFRLRAGTALAGEEVDLGSNDEVFWLWAKRNEPPALYFARHEQAGSIAAAQMLPVEPAWVVDALGLVELDPTAAYQGPFPRADGSLELRAAVVGPSGPVERVTVVEPTHAWVVEQHVYDAAGTLLASAVATSFRFHPQAQVSLPETVTLRVPAANLALTVNTGAVAINAPIANPHQQFEMPLREGYPQVDLGRSDGIPIGGSPGQVPNLSQPFGGLGAGPAYPSPTTTVLGPPVSQEPQAPSRDGGSYSTAANWK